MKTPEFTFKKGNWVWRNGQTLHSRYNSNSYGELRRHWSASRALQGHVHLRLVGRFDSPRAFLPPVPLFLSAGFLLPPELLVFLPFFTTSHFPTEPLFEAISTVQLARQWWLGVPWLPMSHRNLVPVTFCDHGGRCCTFRHVLLKMREKTVYVTAWRSWGLRGGTCYFCFIVNLTLMILRNLAIYFYYYDWMWGATQCVTAFYEKETKT